MKTSTAKNEERAIEAYPIEQVRFLVVMCDESNALLWVHLENLQRAFGITGREQCVDAL